MNLQTLLDIQATFERVLAADGIPIERVVRRRTARDLDLTHQVFVAGSSGRLMQIQLEDDVVPTAFLKQVGVDDSEILLQILVPASNPRVEACLKLFNAWIDQRLTRAEVEAMAQAF